MDQWRLLINRESRLPRQNINRALRIVPSGNLERLRATAATKTPDTTSQAIYALLARLLPALPVLTYVSRIHKLRPCETQHVQVLSESCCDEWDSIYYTS